MRKLYTLVFDGLIVVEANSDDEAVAVAQRDLPNADVGMFEIIDVETLEDDDDEEDDQ